MTFAATGFVASIMLGFLILVILLFTSLSIKIVKEGERVVVERLGAYYTTLEAGVHFLMPGFDRVKAIIRETEAIHVSKQTFGTSDDRKVEYTLKIVYEILNPKLFVYGVQDIDRALSLMSNDILQPKILRIDSSELNFETEALTAELKDEITTRIEAWGLLCKNTSIRKKI